MSHRLKRFRVQAGMTQSQVAVAVGVTQPNYQRWESGSAPIPEAKLAKLASALNTSVDRLLGRHPPIEAAFYDPSASEDLEYYGEVAIHFFGSGAPLLLSISESAFSSLHRSLQSEAPYMAVRSLANQTIALRTKSISDIYFSSEADDSYGPEHDDYRDHLDLQIPDTRDWEIIECFAVDGCGIEDFSEQDVTRVREWVMITDEQYDKLVVDGLISLDDLSKEKLKNQAKTESIFEAATQVKYQMSNGVVRKLFISDEKELYNAFYEIIDFSDEIDLNQMIRLEIEGRHKIAFLNKDAIDYIMVPTHKFENGRTEAIAEDLG